MDGAKFDSKGQRTAMVFGSAIFDLNGQKL
jgi:hypothetical protein